MVTRSSAARTHHGRPSGAANNQERVTQRARGQRSGGLASSLAPVSPRSRLVHGGNVGLHAAASQVKGYFTLVLTEAADSDPWNSSGGKTSQLLPGTAA